MNDLDTRMELTPEPAGRMAAVAVSAETDFWAQVVTLKSEAGRQAPARPWIANACLR